MENNLAMEAILNRRSVRAYEETPLTEMQISQLVEAALAAPSARNTQPWRIIVVQNPPLLEEIETETMVYYRKAGQHALVKKMEERGGTVFYHAPVTFFIAKEDGGSSHLDIDVGICAQNLVLAAQSMGLGSVILGLPEAAFQGEKKTYFEKKLQFPVGFSFGIAVAVGYAADEGVPHEIDQEKRIDVGL